MRTSLVLSAALVAVVGASGCVSSSKYQEAVTETDATRSELDKVRQQKNSLELQVKSLKDTNGKIIAEAELAQAELQRLKESREKERESIEGRIRDQEQKIKDLIAQHKALRQEYDEAKLRNETLTAAVARYQKELKDRQNAAQSAPALPKSPTSAAPTPPVPPSASAAAPKLPTPPARVPAPAPSAPATQSAALAPVNVNTATANDMVLFLGLTKEVAERIVSNRPYKVRGELVAKNVLPKATYDVIKDRITVTP
jgi:DNA uptake protein ComE-like DNA-binding protein/outer membrane murein-binding lipoprotein Lpp